MKTQSGMTILESTIALAIIGVIAIGILMGINLADRIGAGTKKRAKAVQIAKAQMEEIMAMPYSDIVDAEDEDFLYNNPDAIPYTLTTDVTVESEAGAETGKRVTLQIAWEENYSQTVVAFIGRE